MKPNMRWANILNFIKNFKTRKGCQKKKKKKKKHEEKISMIVGTMLQINDDLII